MKNSTIPDLYVEQALLGELPDAKRKTYDSEDLRLGMEELQISDRDILAKYNPAEIAEKIQLRLESEPEVGAGKRNRIVTPTWFVQHRGAAYLAAAALAVLIGVSSFLFQDASPEDPASPGAGMTRIKGMDPEISLYRKLDGSVEQLIDETAARENDLLQIRYNAAGKIFGAIFSIDGRGVLTLHLPIERNGSLVLERDGDVALDYAYRLDDAPRFEKFFFVTSDTTFNIETVLSAAGDLAERLVRRNLEGVLDLPDGLDQTSFTVRKEGSK